MWLSGFCASAIWWLKVIMEPSPCSWKGTGWVWLRTEFENQKKLLKKVSWIFAWGLLSTSGKSSAGTDTLERLWISFHAWMISWTTEQLQFIICQNWIHWLQDNLGWGGNTILESVFITLNFRFLLSGTRFREWTPCCTCAVCFCHRRQV